MAERGARPQVPEWQQRGLRALRALFTPLLPDDYLELIMHKTCWYTTIHPLRVGALVGSAGTADLAPLVRFGFHFGAAFQIRDDLLNLVGDEQSYGKEILGDLYEGKRTLPLVHLLSTATGEDLALVRDYLRRNRSERTPEMVTAVRELDGRVPEVILVDYHLDHGETGCTALKELRKHFGQVPAVMITADRSDECRRALQSIGVPLLNKPVKPGKLRAVLSQLLNGV